MRHGGWGQEKGPSVSGGNRMLTHLCSDTSICINVGEHWAPRGRWGLPLWLATYQLCVNFKMGL